MALGARPLRWRSVLVNFVLSLVFVFSFVGKPFSWNIHPRGYAGRDVTHGFIFPENSSLKNCVLSFSPFFCFLVFFCAAFREKLEKRREKNEAAAATQPEKNDAEKEKTTPIVSPNPPKQTNKRKRNRKSNLAVSFTSHHCQLRGWACTPSNQPCGEVILRRQKKCGKTGCAYRAAVTTPSINWKQQQHALPTTVDHLHIGRRMLSGAEGPRPQSWEVVCVVRGWLAVNAARSDEQKGNKIWAKSVPAQKGKRKKLQELFCQAYSSVMASLCSKGPVHTSLAKEQFFFFNPHTSTNVHNLNKNVFFF